MVSSAGFDFVFACVVFWAVSDDANKMHNADNVIIFFIYLIFVIVSKVEKTVLTIRLIRLIKVNE
jgi:hypothetical protein